MNTKEQQRAHYLRQYRKMRSEKEAADGLEAPLAESVLRRRSCTKCGEAVEPKSYWYCNLHNVLALESEDNHYDLHVSRDIYE